MKDKTSIIIAGSVAAVIVVFMVLISLFKFGVIGNYNNTTEKPKEPDNPITPTITTRNLSCNKSGEDNTTGSILTESVSINFKNDILDNYSLSKSYQYSSSDEYNSKGTDLQNRIGTNVVDGLTVVMVAETSQLLYMETVYASLSELQNANWHTKHNLADFTYNSINSYYINQGFNCQ